ncbi:hypothetical protein RHMOL_Rhmol01G0282900 [Rhododendron molle]|uniref:Uncharacterized protein n=1 Tax=Rhododendron molle TaxID=49168 RepID=A0ACC0Q6P4_RHOML|nr:hypothetical protein RHMOL_Rhmol01G0282900 [Rhododendron molle]
MAISADPFEPSPCPALKIPELWGFVWGLGRVWGFFFLKFGDRVGGRDRSVPAPNPTRPRSPFVTRPAPSPKYIYLYIEINKYILYYIYPFISIFFFGFTTLVHDCFLF